MKKNHISIIKIKLILIFFTFYFLSINPLHSKPLKILWWNVRNCFDTIDDPLTEDTQLSKNDYQKKIALISKTLMRAKVDIAGLTEVENVETVKKIAEKSGFKYYYLKEGNDPRGVNIALVSQLKMKYISHKDQPTPYKENIHYRFSRDCPEAVFQFENITIHLLLNHLKAPIGDKTISLKKRIAQTFGILDIINTIYKNNSTEPALIIAGDFNSHRLSEPMNILEKSGLVILNYQYHKNDVFTTQYYHQKNDIDFFILNKKLYHSLNKHHLMNMYTKEIRQTSDHYPLILRLDIKTQGKNK